MKKVFLTTSVIVSLLLPYFGIQAQNVTNKLDQLKLAQTFFVGTWKQDIVKDTIEVWEVQLHGKAFISTGYRVENGRKHFSFAEDWGYSSEENIFKGFILQANGEYQTFIGSFISEKKFSGNVIHNFNPELVTGKFETVFETPERMTATQLNTNGVKTGESLFYKVK